MADAARSHLLLVLAADPDDYVGWCRATGRTPFAGSAYAMSPDTGVAVIDRRTFQVTDRWREDSENRRTLDALLREGVQYGDENGPWPPGRMPDLSWPRWWQRLLPGRRTAA